MVTEKKATNKKTVHSKCIYYQLFAKKLKT